MRALFDSPTVAGLAEAVIRAQLGAANPEELEELLRSVEQLSPEEVARENRMINAGERSGPASDAAGDYVGELRSTATRRSSLV